MSSNERKGIVCGILSGDSLVVRFLDGQYPIQVICLEYLIAPKFGRTDGKIRDEPFGYDSWEFLRDFCIGKRVIVSDSKPSDQFRVHPAFGQLSVVFTQVTLFDSNEDVGLIACGAGWVKIRELKANLRTPSINYLNSLNAAQQEAKDKHLGIWGDRQGLVRSLPVYVDIEKILNERNFDCNVDGIKNSTTFSVFLLPSHVNILFTLAGARPVKFSEEDQAKKQALKSNIRNIFLNRKIRISITSFNESSNSEIPIFTGIFTDEKNDKQFASIIEQGYALVHKNIYEHVMNADLYAHRQYLAQSKRAGYWSVVAPPILERIPPFTGKVLSIRGSNGLNVLVEGRVRVVYFNNIKIPKFSPNLMCEAIGYEAREYLRKMLVRKNVTIEEEGQLEEWIYATVIYEGVSINELLCRNGFAKISEPVCGIHSSKLQRLNAVENEAKNSEVGIWSNDLPPPYMIHDYTLNYDITGIFFKLRGMSIRCIVEHVLSVTRYIIYVPEVRSLIRISLSGIASMSSQDQYNNISKSYCQDNFLHSDCEIEVLGYDDRKGLLWVNMFTADNKRNNISIDLLKLGLSEIHQSGSNSSDVPQELIDAQEYGKMNRHGIWSDPSRFPHEIDPKRFYSVIVLSVISPIEMIVQMYPGEIKLIEKEMQNSKLPLNEVPTKNGIVMFWFQDRGYRARIMDVDGNNNAATISLIDFSTEVEEVKFGDLFQLPLTVRQIPPQAIRVVLAGLRLNEKSEEQYVANKEYVHNFLHNALLYMKLVKYENDTPYVVLLDHESIDQSVHFGTVLIKEGIASFVEGQYPEQFKPIFDQLKMIT